MISFIFTHTPLRFLVQSFWRDEAFSYLMAKQDLATLFITTAKDANPPLYYLLLKWWMMIFGQSEAAIRLLSVIFFLITLFVIYLFLNRVFNIPVKKSVVYLLLFATNPLLHYYAFEARMYSLLALLSALSFYFFIRKKHIPYVLVSVMGLYTHYFMIFTLISQAVYYFLIHKKNKTTLLRALFSAGGILFLFIPWVLFVIVAKPPAHNTFWTAKPDLFTLLNMGGTLITGYEEMNGFFPFMFIFSLTVYSIIAAGIFRLGKKQRRNLRPHLIFLICWFLLGPLVIFAFSFWQPLFVPRYLIYATLGFLLFLVLLFDRLKPNIKAALFTATLVLSIGFSFIQVHARTKANVKKPLLEIKKLIKQGDAVFVTHEYNFHIAKYYIPDADIYIFGKTYSKLPWYVGKILIQEHEVTSSLPVYPRRAFILNDNLSVTVRALY